MAWEGGQWTIGATATSIASALALPEMSERRVFSKVTVKNADGAANALYLGGRDVLATPANAAVELGAGDSYTFGSGNGKSHVNTADIYMVGTANAANIAFIIME